MKTFLILGAGSAGTMMVRTMSRKLDPQEWKIIVVDRDKAHYYQPGFLFIPFGIYKPSDAVQPKTSFIPRNVEMVWSDIERIEPDENRVTLTEGKRVIHYDELVIATGCEIRPDQVGGMNGAGWYQNVFDFYTYEGSVALAKAMERFQGGKLVVHITEMPVKCPVAPLEFVLLADDYLRKKGLRTKTELIYATPLSDAFTKPRANKVLGNMFKERGISLVTDFAASEVDSSRNVIASYGGQELNYDLLVTVPTNMGVEAVERSGIGDDLNYIPTDKFTLQSKQWQNVWVLGDANNIPASKAGSVVHFQQEIAAENILNHIAGKPLTAQFDGHSLCYIESGKSKAILIDFNYDVEPVPGTYPIPGIGPFSLLKETWINHMGKLAFRYMYWMMLKGINIPLPSRMNTAGKDL